VQGLEGLRRELTLLALDELTAAMSAAAVGRSRRDALHGIAYAYRDFATRRPGLYPATLRAPDPDDAELVAAGSAALDVVLAVLAGYGLSGEDAVDAARALRALLHGWVALEAAGGFGMPQDVDRSYRRLLDGFNLALSPAR
jgi:hypothetical protein